MIKNVTFKDRCLTLFFDAGEFTDIDVGISIYKIVFTSKYVVVLLSWEELNDTELHNCNIVCFNEKGKILWRIVNQDTLSLSKEKTCYSWTSLELKNDSCVRVGTFSGMEVDVDINSGKLLGNAKYTK